MGTGRSSAGSMGIISDDLLGQGSDHYTEESEIP